MYLKTLELHGFKSFPNRTVLTFERGATVIVGPNGSGKSNISDAMRWVLGELSSRNIRGTKMEDVIFGGTDDRRPMGFAEVSVTFDNSDPENRLDSEFDEVTVTRRYYRTGESEYLINKQPKRLRDIYELFMNTGVGREGYSIIGQGKIAEIISKKSDERRNIFEEAAGISKFRHRKEESEKKLKNTQDNLDRVRDILTELENRVGPLEKEAEKARKGLAIYEEKKRADVSLWLFDTKKIREDIECAERDWKLSAHELEIIDQVISDLEAQDQTLYLKAQSNKMLSEQLFNEINETSEKLRRIDNALQSAESDFAHSRELIEQCYARINEIERSRSVAKDGRSNFTRKKDEHIKALENILTERQVYLDEQAEISKKVVELSKILEEALDELTVEENLYTNLKVRIDVLKNTSINDKTKSQDIVAEIEKYQKEAEALEKRAEVCEKNASGFKKQIAEQDEAIRLARENIEKESQERDRLLSERNSARVEMDSLVERADALQRMCDLFEGYADSVKFVMREYNRGNIKGEIYGPLSSLINVDKKYITAIETALGSSLQNIVVDNENTAKAAIASLKAANAGRATFYPVSAIKSATEIDEIREAKRYDGFVGRADTLVGSDDKYRSIVEWLLLRTLVFDNIDNASAAAKALRYRVKIVTLDGQVINAGGSFSGGSTKRDSGILSRLTEISTMRSRAQTLNGKIDECNKKIAKCEEIIKQNKTAELDAEQEKEILFSLSRTQFAELDTANANLNANKNILDKLKYDYDALMGNSSAAEAELVELNSNFVAAGERIEAIKAMRSKRAEEMGVLDERSDELTSKAAEAYIRATEARKDIENTQQMIESIDERIGELDNEKAEQEAKVEAINEQRRGIEDQRKESKDESERLEAKLLELRKKRTDVESGNDEFDREINAIRQKIKEKSAGRQVAFESSLKNENRLNQLLERQDKLGSQLWDEYEITYEDAVELAYPEVTEENREEMGKVQSSCRARLRALGNYNPGAIDEYAEVKERYDTLNTQYTDLTNSYNELTGIIARLEVEMRSGFIDAFESINKNFGITFKELFGGGSAELSLTDPDDVLSSGIEIKAAPPGKIIKSLSLLSGGEQSFVAIALLFAILKVNPTPFCILDEIEAALDEVNVFRFGEYIKRLADETQFILITHRRGTMEVGNRLYGVTMPQRGISQAIELNVNEIEGKQKELLG